MTPKTVLAPGKDGKLDAHCAALFGVLDEEQGDRGNPWRGRTELIEYVGWSHHTVTKHLRHLEERGLVKVLSDGHHKVRFWVINPARAPRAIPDDLTAYVRPSRPLPAQRAKAEGQDVPNTEWQAVPEYSADTAQPEGQDVPKIWANSAPPLRSKRSGEGLEGRCPPSPARDPRPVPEQETPVDSVDSKGEISGTDAAAIALMEREFGPCDDLGQRLQAMVDEADTKGVSAAEAMAALDIDGPTLDDLVQAMSATEDAGLHGRRLYASKPF